MLDTERSVCERLLHEVAGTPVRITGTQHLGGSWAPVERIILASKYPQVGRSVVVKTRRRDETGWGGDPASLSTEGKSLTFLENVGLDIAPRLLAHDATAGVVVMSDLGPGPSVEQMLFEFSFAEAHASLDEMASSAGRLHARTTSKGSVPSNPLAVFMAGLGEPWGKLIDAVDSLGFPRPNEVSADMENLATSLSAPRFRTFTHGDLVPNNAMLCNGTVRLVDFESAGPRHAFLDAANLRLPFPAYGHWAVLPPNVLASMDHAYRTELAKALPAAEDDLEYGRAMTVGCTAWAIVRLCRLRVIAKDDQEPDEKLRRRSQIVQTITSCVATADQSNSFPALMAWLISVTEEMRKRWPEANAEPRQFPAFTLEAR